jgi:hypothetical protein
MYMTDITAGLEDGQLNFNMLINGAQVNPLYINAGAAILTFPTSGTNLQVANTSPDAGGANVQYYRNSSSPAANDGLHVGQRMGNNAALTLLDYARASYSITDPTTGSEDGTFVVYTRTAGTYAPTFYAGGGCLIYDAAGAPPSGGDKGPGTLNAFSLWESGVSMVSKYAALGTANTFFGTQNTSQSTTVTAAFNAFNNEPGAGSFTSFQSDRGSPSPAASDLLAQVVFSGRNTSAAFVAYAWIDAMIIDPTAATVAAILRFVTSAAGAVNVRYYIGTGFYYPAATGGDKGAGTINVSQVYANNVLLTSMPASAEFRKTGDFDVAAWDAIVPEGQEHHTAHLFKAMLDDGFDPRRPENFVEKFRRDEVLPGMPERRYFEREFHNTFSLDNLLSRLWLATDIIGVSFAATVDRLGDVEARLDELERTLH